MASDAILQTRRRASSRQVQVSYHQGSGRSYRTSRSYDPKPDCSGRNRGFQAKMAIWRLPALRLVHPCERTKALSDQRTRRKACRQDYMEASKSFLITIEQRANMNTSGPMNPLRAFRKANGLTAIQVANRLGVSERSVLAWEKAAF